ncbi:MAG: hypothetical protein EP343_18490 [Deltaproteobacteria bacterium]|nr:MAG: hypothetical protein EP343_18490 [Deltaproteobacteria bacterium]
MSTTTRLENNMTSPQPTRSDTPTRRHKVRMLWGLCLTAVTAVTLLFGMGCGGKGDDINAFLSAPESNTFVKGLVTIRARMESLSRVQRASLVIRHNEDITLTKELIRQENPPGTWDFDWDTTNEKEGPYTIELQVLRTDGYVQLSKKENVWVVNKPAELKITECEQPPLVARDKVQLNLAWTNVPKEMPPTAVELFVQGNSAGRLSKPPYKFDLDLSNNKDGEELLINAIATSGIYRGSTSVCSIRIDRKGPQVRFLFPQGNGTVPGKFSASVEVEEEFGIKEVRILAEGVEVGKLTQPPFQIPVDLSKKTHGAKVKLKAVAVDRAGNETDNPPEIEVTVDTEAPTVNIKSPIDDSNHLNDVKYVVDIKDGSGLAIIDFYVLDEKDQRVDNILHVDGLGKTELNIDGSIFSPLTRYGSGKRKLETVVRDIHGNITKAYRNFVVGCKTPQDCPSSGNPTAPYLCLGNRCLIPREPGERCTYDFSCKPPYVCYFGGLSFCAKEKIGICRKPCQPNRGDCAAGEFCLAQKDGNNICFPGDPCGPFTYNCSKTEQCTPWGADSFVCLPTGFANEGEPCKPYACDNTLNCGKGFGCVVDQSSNQTQGKCRRLCDAEFPVRDCGPGQQCVAFPLQDNNINSMGYCAQTPGSGP